MSTGIGSLGDTCTPTTKLTLGSAVETSVEESWTIYPRVYELIVFQEMQTQTGVGLYRLKLLSGSLTPEEYSKYKWQKELKLLTEVVKKFEALRGTESYTPPPITVSTGTSIYAYPDYVGHYTSGTMPTNLTIDRSSLYGVALRSTP